MKFRLHPYSARNDVQPVNDVPRAATCRVSLKNVHRAAIDQSCVPHDATDQCLQDACRIVWIEQQ